MRSWESLYEAGWRDGQWHDMLKAGLALISPSSYPPFYSDASNIALFVHISKRLGWADPSEAVAKFGLCLAQMVPRVTWVYPLAWLKILSLVTKVYVP